MTLARLWPVVLALVLALGSLAVPATAAPAQDGGAVWTRDDPVLNPSKQPLVRDQGAGGTYTWSAPTLTGLTVTNDWPHNWHWESKVTWDEPPAQFVEGVAQTLKITSSVTTKGTSGGIDVNANWGWQGFSAPISRGDTAVCSGACGSSATKTVALTLPPGAAYDKDHPENNPTLWVTVDGQTTVYAHYSRSTTPSALSQTAPGDSAAATGPSDLVSPDGSDAASCPDDSALPPEVQNLLDEEGTVQVAASVAGQADPASPPPQSCPRPLTFAVLGDAGDQPFTSYAQVDAWVTAPTSLEQAMDQIVAATRSGSKIKRLYFLAHAGVGESSTKPIGVMQLGNTFYQQGDFQALKTKYPNISKAFAPHAAVTLLNCQLGNDPSLVKTIAELLLGENGGFIDAKAGDVGVYDNWLFYSVDTPENPAVLPTWFSKASGRWRVWSLHSRVAGGGVFEELGNQMPGED